MRSSNRTWSASGLGSVVSGKGLESGSGVSGQSQWSGSGPGSGSGSGLGLGLVLRVKVRVRVKVRASSIRSSYRTGLHCSLPSAHTTVAKWFAWLGFGPGLG
eukprot:scaffold110576_cov42-Phaeocystis_antarctica.AAC.1